MYIYTHTDELTIHSKCICVCISISYFLQINIYKLLLSIGTPDHNDIHGAIVHLYKLLNSCFSSIAATSTSLTFEYIRALPLVLIGFSKGCVVLNQILYELNQFIKPVIDNVQANTSEDSIGNHSNSDIYPY